MQENPRINQQDRQKITFMDLLTPRRSPNTAHPLHTQNRSSALPEGLLGVFHACLWPL